MLARLSDNLFALTNTNDKAIRACQYAFFSFLFIHLLTWVILPTLLLKGTYIDVLENWEWGRHFQWGYDKDPPLVAWITYWALYFTSKIRWIPFFLSQLSVITGLIAIWRLATRLLPPVSALLSTTLLMTIFFYSIGSVEFNDDVAEICMWALTCLFFYDATKKQNFTAWLLVGIFAGLASMTKYFTLMLLLAMFTFLLSNSTARRSFKNINFYSGFAIFLAIVIPNFIWLIHHSFVAIHYAFHSAKISTVAFDEPRQHVISLLLFLTSLFVLCLPSWLVMRGCFKKTFLKNCDTTIDTFNIEYLVYMTLGPIVFMGLFILATGAGFSIMWFTPMLNLIGIFLFAWLKPQLTMMKIQSYCKIVFYFIIGWPIAYLIYETTAPHLVKDLTRFYEIFPGTEMATALTTAWQDRYHTPLAYVAGRRAYVLNISHYSKDQPQSYFEWNPAYSQWINETDLKKKGGLFIYKTTDDGKPTIPADITARFPQMTTPSVYHFNWAYYDFMAKWFHWKKLEPLQVTVAFLPPAGLK